jgi:hypothetical protein
MIFFIKVVAFVYSLFCVLLVTYNLYDVMKNWIKFRSRRIRLTPNIGKIVYIKRMNSYGQIKDISEEGYFYDYRVESYTQHYFRSQYYHEEELLFIDVLGNN